MARTADGSDGAAGSAAGRTGVPDGGSGTTGLADVAALLLDAAGRVQSWPPAAERLLGHPPSGAIGRPAADLLAPDDAARLPALAAECRAHGSWSGLLSALHAGGGRAGIQVQVVPVTGGTARGHWLVLAADAPPLRGWEPSRDVLERMVSRSPVGMAIVDTDLRCVWSNAALEQYGGGSSAERAGRRLGEIQPGLDAEAMETRMRHVLRTGEPLLGFEHVGRTLAEPQREHAHSMSFFRLEDAEGRPVGVCYTVIDITERYRSRQHLALLDRASEHLGRTLDVLQTAQDLADVAVPELADFVTVDLLDSVVRGEEPRPGPLGDADDVPLRRGGQQSLRAGVPEAVVRIGDLAAYHAWSPPVRCLADGVSWRAERLDPRAPEWAAGVAGGRHANLRELGLHTAMVVPIRARGSTMGVTTFFRIQHDEPFSADDLRLAEEFVARAAVCVDNARRYTREREAALGLQRRLLPRGTPDQRAVTVASAYCPANELCDVGGNWFDVIVLSGARVALVVGDVPGHGIDAAATMGRLRTAVRTLAALDLRPEELLAHLDDLVGRSIHEGQRHPSGADERGSSCLYAVYDPIALTCTAASAGHPLPAVVAPGGAPALAELPVGPRLGEGGLPFEAVEFPVAEGSVLALYTDGLLAGDGTAPGAAAGGSPGSATEENAPEQDAPEQRDPVQRLLRALGAPGHSLDGLCDHVIDALTPERPQDDVTLLLAATRALAPEEYGSWELPADPATVAVARDTATTQLAHWGLEALAFTTELVVSELVTNAIRHGGAPIGLRLIKDRTLICEVSDGSSTSPYLRHARTTDEGGRGLFLISQLTERWGTRYTAEGKVIWTEQALEPRDM
ncbi:PAS domain S-box protein [Streptomyces sp. Ru73]|uniref:SpoIIE family protein phosphatase n=1 Tax=Streptomyces sp. Ru73 TaxID=2080748 RepID=UPI000CDE1112|nr:SpoIIE family protein phosphatase [Streptomyces sp. Ru73]POX36661.1 PAS domain S-box protein [Streptomyces sp. Ru73]